MEFIFYVGMYCVWPKLAHFGCCVPLYSLELLPPFRALLGYVLLVRFGVILLWIGGISELV